MPDIRDFLPQPPWEGPPLPKILQKANPITEKEAEQIIREWLKTKESHIKFELYKRYPEVEPYAKRILERMVERREVELIEDMEAAWVDWRGRTIARAFLAERLK